MKGALRCKSILLNIIFPSRIAEMSCKYGIGYLSGHGLHDPSGFFTMCKGDAHSEADGRHMPIFCKWVNSFLAASSFIWCESSGMIVNGRSFCDNVVFGCRIYHLVL